MNRQYFLLYKILFLFLQIKCFRLCHLSNCNENGNIYFSNGNKIALRKQRVKIWFEDLLSIHDYVFLQKNINYLTIDSNQYYLKMKQNFANISNNIFHTTHIKPINLNKNFCIDDKEYYNPEECVAYSKPIEKSVNFNVFLGGYLNVVKYLKLICMMDLFNMKNNIGDVFQYTYFGFYLQNVVGIMCLFQFYYFKNFLIAGCYKHINFGISYNIDNKKFGIVLGCRTSLNFVIMFNIIFNRE